MILVAGGTGLLGRRVVKLLVGRGEKVRVLTREPGRAAPLPAGIDVVVGDIRRGSLERALDGCSGVVSAVHGFAGPTHTSPAAVDRSGNRKLMAAAEGAGVARFVLVSVLGAAPDHPMSLHRMKYAAEQELTASSLAGVVIRSAPFLETWIDVIGNGIPSGRPAIVLGPRPESDQLRIRRRRRRVRLPRDAPRSAHRSHDLRRRPSGSWLRRDRTASPRAPRSLRIAETHPPERTQAGLCVDETVQAGSRAPSRRGRGDEHDADGIRRVAHPQPVPRHPCHEPLGPDRRDDTLAGTLTAGWSTSERVIVTRSAERSRPASRLRAASADSLGRPPACRQRRKT